METYGFPWIFPWIFPSNLGGRPKKGPWQSTSFDRRRWMWAWRAIFFGGGTMKNDDLSDLSICFLMGISEYHGTWMNMMISLW
jgi:hypothetical protein